VAISGGTVTIPAGSTSVNVVVTVNGDGTVEADETFFVDLSGLLAAGRDVSFGDSQGQGTIENDDSPPIPDADGPYTIGEGDGLTLDASGSSDPDGDPLTYRWDVDGDGDFDENVTGVNPTLTWAQLVALGIDDGPYSGTVTVEANDGSNTATDSSTLTVNNVAPDVSAAPTAHDVQYSDPITAVVITATDVAADTMNAGTQWSVDGGSFSSGLPDAVTIAGGLALNGASDQTSPASWTLAGVADLGPGDYVVRVTVTDDDGGATSVDVTIEVRPEDAIVELEPDNPVAVMVESDGGNSGVFTLDVTLTDSPDGFAGDIDQATLSVVLVPVGPGSPVSGVCAMGASGTGEWSCTFDDVPVNTYNVVATAGGFYTGLDEDVLTVFDPSLGFTTGGGTYVDPVSGDRVNFGYTMKYNKKHTNVQGSLLVIRHTDDGVIRLKSNKIEGLALGSGADFEWASFTGKATYKEADWDDAVGNYDFVVYVEDHGTPGAGTDRIWVTAQRAGELAAGLSMDDPATVNAVIISGGNIVVPHQGGGGRGAR
jgi:hypothetical protein